MPSIDNSESYEAISWILENADTGFFIVAASHHMQKKISDLYSTSRVALFDCKNIENNFEYSELIKWVKSHEEINVLFILDMQLAFVDEKGYITDEQLLKFNLSRDVLSKQNKLWIFFMTKEAEDRLSTFAYDIYSYVRQKIYFVDEENDDTESAQILDFSDSYNFEQIKRQLKRYKKIEDSYMELTLSNTPDSQLLSAAVTLMNIAKLYYDCDDYNSAINLYSQIIKIREKVLGLEHLDTAKAYNDIAVAYSDQGNYDKALEWYYKALSINLELLELEHPNIPAIYNNIAIVFNRQGDNAKALEWHYKALSINEKVRGLEHPDTATMYNNIAGVYLNQGDYAKALEWYYKSLSIKENVLGLEHPDTAATYNNIALVYSNQGDYAKALEWYYKALSIREKILGLEHPNTAATYNNIAFVYSEQGDYGKALEWYYKALSINEKVLGLEHPSTVQIQNSITNISKIIKSENSYIP